MSELVLKSFDRVRRHRTVTGAGDFFRWWRNQLVSGLPDSVRSKLHTDSVGVVAWFEDEYLMLQSTEGNELGRVLISEDADIAAQEVRVALAALDEDRPEIHFLLAENDVLAREVLLPAAAEDNLDDVLRFEMDKHTPFKADDVYFDYRIVDRLQGGARLKLQLVLARREVVDSIARMVTERGLKLRGVDVGSPNGRLGVNLLPESERARRDYRQLYLNLALLVVFLGLFYFVMWQSVETRTQALADYQERVNVLRVEASEVAQLTEELQQASDAAQFLGQRKEQQPAVIDVLRSLTMLLPDDTWLQRLQISDDTVDVSGQAPEAAQLISVLEKSPYLSQPSLKGAVTPDPRTGKERFTITAQLEQPDPGTLAIAEPPAQPAEAAQADGTSNNNEEVADGLDTAG